MTTESVEAWAWNDTIGIMEQFIVPENYNIHRVDYGVASYRPVEGFRVDGIFYRIPEPQVTVGIGHIQPVIWIKDDGECVSPAECVISTVEWEEQEWESYLAAREAGFQHNLNAFKVEWDPDLRF